MQDDIVRLKSDIFTDGFSFRVNKYVYDEYDLIHMHCHDFIEIAFVAAGKGYHSIDGKKTDVSKGDLFILNTDTPHSFYPLDRENSGRLAVFNCMFMPDFIKNFGIEAGLLKNIIHLFLYQSLFSDELGYPPDVRLKGHAIAEMEALFEKLHCEYVRKQEGYADLLRLYLCELLVRIYRFHASQGGRPETSDYKLQLINNSLAYLRENLTNRLSLEEISQHVFLSKSYFAALFKSTTGTGVFDYIQKLRIEKACSLLLTTDETVTEISRAVGYNDYRFFNKTFKKITGLTAQEYRRRERQ